MSDMHAINRRAPAQYPPSPQTRTTDLAGRTLIRLTAIMILSCRLRVMLGVRRHCRRVCAVNKFSIYLLFRFLSFCQNFACPVVFHHSVIHHASLRHSVSRHATLRHSAIPRPPPFRLPPCRLPPFRLPPCHPPPFRLPPCIYHPPHAVIRTSCRVSSVMLGRICVPADTIVRKLRSQGGWGKSEERLREVEALTKIKSDLLVCGI